MKPPLLLTYGMGIGPEITLKALSDLQTKNRLILLGKEDSLDRRQRVQIPQVDTLSCEYPVARMPFSDGKQVAEVLAIEYAARACLHGHASAMITGPINKKRLSEQGFLFKGHTDFLGSLCAKEPVMAFTGGRLKVALVTTHIPLMAVGEAITVERIAYTVRTAAFHLKRDLGIENPRFAVCGLNPHAGEQGMLGTEEIETIHPACQILRAEGYLVQGAVSAETAFLQAQNQRVDMVVAMYHDQGLAPAGGRPPPELRRQGAASAAPGNLSF